MGNAEATSFKVDTALCQEWPTQVRSQHKQTNPVGSRQRRGQRKTSQKNKIHERLHKKNAGMLDMKDKNELAQGEGNTQTTWKQVSD